MDESIVAKLKELMVPIFQKYCVVSDGAKDRCIRGILSGGRILDLARSKYDMAAHLDQSAAVAMFASGSALVQKRRRMFINVSVSPGDRAAIVAANPDLQIEFDFNKRVNHSTAYVQRIIETKRSLSSLRHDRGHISDIGGNPAFHAAAGHDNVHSCMLCDNLRDLGRNVRRDVEASFSGNTVKLNFCTQGVQECIVDSVEALSLYAIQDIDPIVLATALCRKGVEFCTGVFHYDPIMFEQSEGYFPYLKMHYQKIVSRKSGRPAFSFFFENDPSFDYEHDADRMLRYSRSWSYAVPNSGFVYRYDLTYVGDGTARFTIVRQNREYLGAASNEVAYRYIDHSQVYRIESWTLDLESGTDSEFTGYKKVVMDVQSDLFMFLYKYGLSNDTENPDKLFTVDQLRAQARTFNATRTLCGHVFTGRLVMSADSLEQLLVAMYVVVMRDMAVENFVAMRQVDTMLSTQTERTDKQFFTTTGKIVGFSFALPIIFLSGKVSTFFRYVALLLRKLASAGDLEVKWSVLPSYVRLPSMQRFSGPGLPGDPGLTGHSFVSVDKVESFVQPQVIKDLFSEVLTPEQRLRLEDKLTYSYVPEVDIGSAAETDVEVSGGLSPTLNARFDDADDVDLQWYQDDVEGYLQVKREVLWRRDALHSLASEEEISSHSAPAMLEHARYNFDIATSQVGAAKDKVKEVYAGAPLGNKIQMYNDASASGIKFLRVDNGRVDVPPGESYAFGIDPRTGAYLQLHGNAGGYYVSSKTTSLLFVSADTVMSNGFVLGTKLKALAENKKNKQPRFCLVDAIYGAGKTHEIETRFSIGDVVVTQALASKNDILDVLRKQSRFKGVDLVKYVRTADSAIMHGLPRASVIYIDEGLMMFPGQVFALVSLAKADVAYVFGDSAQIPPIDRSTTLGFLTYQTMCRWSTIEFRNVTYRSPADVVLLLARYYKLDRRTELKTASPVKRSLRLTVVHNPQDKRPFDTAEGYTFITILRVDRGALLVNPRMKDGKKFSRADLKPGESILLNVGEAQGGTFSKVKICRQYMYGDKLFSSPEQTVVAFSRHMLEAEYVTTVPGDPYAMLVGEALAYTESQLESVMVETPGWLKEKFSKLRKEV